MLTDRRVALYLTVWMVCAVNVLLIAVWAAAGPEGRALLQNAERQVTPLWALLGAASAALLAGVDGSRRTRTVRALLGAAVFAAVWGSAVTVTVPVGDGTVTARAQPWLALTLLLPPLIVTHRRLSELPVRALLRLGPDLRAQGAALRAAGFTARRHLFWPATSWHVTRGAQDIVIHLTVGTEAGRPLTARWLERRADLIALRPGARHVLWVALRAPQQQYAAVVWEEPGVRGVTVIGDRDALLGAVLNDTFTPPPPRAPQDVPGMDAAQVRARGARFLSSVPLLLSDLRGVGVQQVAPAHFVLTCGAQVTPLFVWPHPDLPDGAHPDGPLFASLVGLVRDTPGARLWAPLLVDGGRPVGVPALLGGVPAVQALFAVPDGPPEVTPDAYAALGLRPGASLPEVKAAYRRIIKECHPDRTQHLRGRERDAAQARARAVNAAYAQLSGRAPGA